MTDTLERLMYRIDAEETNEKVRAIFESFGQDERYYTDEQKECAFYLIEEKGVRATAKILNLPRKTLQRWCRKQGVTVKRCPDWVRPWAERRRKRKEFWESRGYY